MVTQRQLFLQYVAQTSEAPLFLEIEKAEGVNMWDKDNKKYIDLISGIGVSNVGHRHPKVVEAIKEQIDKYLHLMVYGEFVQGPQVRAAQGIINTLPENFNNVYFVNSGSEAVEGAIKLAKRFNGKREIIYFDKAYHGSTQGALSVNGDEFFKRNYRPLLPDTRMLRFNNLEDLKFINKNTSAVILEFIQGEAGVRKAKIEFYEELFYCCKENEVLIIADEIQSGFGRTGKFWGFENFSIIPDIVVCAKGMGGGMPLGAFISSSQIMGSLKHSPFLGHITTFGGHPVCCAACEAVLDILKSEELLNSVSEKEKLFHKLLVHPAIKEIRSVGLMVAVEFESYEVLKSIIDKCLEYGILTDWFLHCNNSMRIAPPLIISLDEIEESCKIILRAIKETIG